MEKMDVNKFLKDTSNVEVCGIRLEDFDSRALIVTEDNFAEHLQKQSAGTAYYGVIYKSLKQELNKLISDRSRKLVECVDRAMLALQKQTSKNSPKPTIREAETMALMANSKLFEELDRKICEIEEQCNSVEQYYEAWKQKSYALNNITNLVCAGFIKLDDSINIK